MGFDFDENDYISIGSLHNKSERSQTKHGDWVIPVWPSASNLNGSPITPFIFDDRVNDNEVAEAIATVYSWSKEERKRRGLEGREFALKNLSSEVMCNKMIEGIDKTLETFQPRKRFDLYKIV